MFRLFNMLRHLVPPVRAWLSPVGIINVSGRNSAVPRGAIRAATMQSCVAHLFPSVPTMWSGRGAVPCHQLVRHRATAPFASAAFSWTAPFAARPHYRGTSITPSHHKFASTASLTALRRKIRFAKKDPIHYARSEIIQHRRHEDDRKVLWRQVRHEQRRFKSREKKRRSMPLAKQVSPAKLKEIVGRESKMLKWEAKLERSKQRSYFKPPAAQIGNRQLGRR